MTSGNSDDKKIEDAKKQQAIAAWHEYAAAMSKLKKQSEALFRHADREYTAEEIAKIKRTLGI